jgi:hypothetical protein
MAAAKRAVKYYSFDEFAEQCQQKYHKLMIKSTATAKLNLTVLMNELNNMIKNKKTFDLENVSMLHKVKAGIWIIGIKEKYEMDEVFETEIKISNDTFKIIDPSKPRDIVLRIIGLEPNGKETTDGITKFIQDLKIPMNEVIGLFCERIKTEEIVKKHFDIASSVIRIGIKYTEQNAQITKAINPKQKIKINQVENRVLVLKVDEPYKCLYCNQYKHLKKDCDKYNQI